MAHELRHEKSEEKSILLRSLIFWFLGSVESFYFNFFSRFLKESKDSNLFAQCPTNFPIYRSPFASRARCTIESTSWLETPAPLLHYLSEMLQQILEIPRRYLAVWRVCVASSVDAAKGRARCCMAVISQRVPAASNRSHGKYQTIPSQFVQEHRSVCSVECLCPGVWCCSLRKSHECFSASS